MSDYFIKRSKDGRPGWTGPITNPARARREAAAWAGAGWDAEVVPATPEIRAEVMAWQAEADVRLGRRRPPQPRHPTRRTGRTRR